MLGDQSGTLPALTLKKKRKEWSRLHESHQIHKSLPWQEIGEVVQRQGLPDSVRVQVRVERRPFQSLDQIRPVRGIDAPQRALARVVDLRKVRESNQPVADIDIIRRRRIGDGIKNYARVQ